MGGGDPASREAAEQRRQRAYRLYLRQFTQAVIAKTLGVSQRQISRDLSVMQARDSKIVLQEDPKATRRIQAEAAHQYGDVISEQWSLYGRALEETPVKIGLVAAILGDIGRSLERLHNVLRVVPSAELSLAVQEFEKYRNAVKQWASKYPTLDETSAKPIRDYITRLAQQS